MEQPNVLRETKMGQKGFVKEDVLMYLDELNSRIDELKKQLEEASGNKPADSQEIIKYRNQIDNLQEKLNASNNALRLAKKENEELQQQISKLKSGGAAPVAGGASVDAQTKAALEAAKKEIDSLRAQLKAANEKSAAPAASAAGDIAAIEASKKEIENLKVQLKASNDKAAEAEKKAAEAEKKAAEAAKNAGNDNKSADELAKANQEIAKITAELKSKSEELDIVKNNVAEKDSKIELLTKENEAAAKKDEEIAKLNDEIVELKANANNPAAIMGSLFAEAQKTVSQLKLQAEQEANQTTKEAEEKASAVIREANATAEKTINDANNVAERTITEANMKAKFTVEDANTKASKINEMSTTVRSMLLNEIESVNSKFNDITTSIMKLTGQATDRMNEAQTIIGEAKKAVAPSEENSVKLAEAPKAVFEAVKSPTATLGKSETKSENNSDPFSKIAGGSYNSRGTSNSFNKPASNPAPVHEAPKPAPKKPVSNFNFDMSDLLKAAEEEAAKEEQ